MSGPETARDPITSQDREVLHAEVTRLEAEQATVQADTRELEVSLGDLDKNRDAVKEAVILKVEGGKTKFITTVKP